MALAARNPRPKASSTTPIAACNTPANDYVERLEARKIAISMSRPANPYDNAKAESFMKTLKTEEVNGKTYIDLDDARRQIGAFIETVYNAKRLHSALGYKPPAEFEAELGRTRPTNQSRTKPCHSISVSHRRGAVHVSCHRNRKLSP